MFDLLNDELENDDRTWPTPGRGVLAGCRFTPIMADTFRFPSYRITKRTRVYATSRSAETITCSHVYITRKLFEQIWRHSYGTPTRWSRPAFSTHRVCSIVIFKKLERTSPNTVQTHETSSVELAKR